MGQHDNVQRKTQGLNTEGGKEGMRQEESTAGNNHTQRDWGEAKLNTLHTPDKELSK